jgi:hypothetical protein
MLIFPVLIKVVCEYVASLVYNWGTVPTDVLLSLTFCVHMFFYSHREWKCVMCLSLLQGLLSFISI